MRDRRILGLVIAGVVLFAAIGVWLYQSRATGPAAVPQAASTSPGAVASTGSGSKRQNPQTAEAALMMAARNLTDQERAALEARLDANPDDMEARQMLMAYHWFPQNRSSESNAIRTRHTLWFIEHAPESAVTGSPMWQLDKIRDREAYAKADALWRKHLESQPDNPRIMAHAAGFFLIHDRTTAIDLYKRGEQLEPDNPTWSRNLAQALTLGAGMSTQGEANATAAFDASERALSKTTGMERFYMLSQAAKAAFTAGQIDTARQHATELLDMSIEAEQDWNYGNAVHFGNLILGRIALAAGDVDAAESHLLRAGRTPGSPQLNSFGPNMMLAKELLEAGRTQAVLDYLDLCAVFWKQPQIQQWKSQINAGKTPSFGANLVY